MLWTKAITRLLSLGFMHQTDAGLQLQSNMLLVAIEGQVVVLELVLEALDFQQVVWGQVHSLRFNMHAGCIAIDVNACMLIQVAVLACCRVDFSFFTRSEGGGGGGGLSPSGRFELRAVGSTSALLVLVIERISSSSAVSVVASQQR